AQGASIEATQAQVDRLEKALANDPDVDHWSFYVGKGAVRFYLPLNVQLENANFAQAVVVTKSFAVRDRVQARLESLLNERFDTLMARVEPLNLGPPVEWPIQYRVSGPSIDGVRRAAQQVADVVRANADTRVVDFNWNELRKAVRIEINQDEARRLGLTSEQVARSLNDAFSGRSVTQVRDATYLVDVRGRAQARDRGDLQSLRDLEVGIGNGKSVPLAQVARFEYGLEEARIWRRDRLPTITVQSDIAKGLPAATAHRQPQPPPPD